MWIHFQKWSFPLISEIISQLQYKSNLSQWLLFSKSFSWGSLSQNNYALFGFLSQCIHSQSTYTRLGWEEGCIKRRVHYSFSGIHFKKLGLQPRRVKPMLQQKQDGKVPDGIPLLSKCHVLILIGLSTFILSFDMPTVFYWPKTCINVMSRSYTTTDNT